MENGPASSRTWDSPVQFMNKNVHDINGHEEEVEQCHYSEGRYAVIRLKKTE